MPAVSFENLSKRYRLGQFGYRTFREDLYNRSSKLLQPRSNKSKSYEDFIWALDDVSFNVGQGETLDIIGPNGAGKTTILRLLAGITNPTQGRTSAKGRIWNMKPSFISVMLD